MAYYGNKDTGEVNPSNFATRPGIIVGGGPAPQSDYLFGANMGLTHLENNLNISKSKIKTRLPYPTSIGALQGREVVQIFGAVAALGGIALALNEAVNQGEVAPPFVFVAMGTLLYLMAQEEGGIEG